MSPTDHIFASDASHCDDDAALQPLPFGVRLVVAFLGLDALERAVELGTWIHAFRTSIGIPPSSTPPNFPVLGLWIAVDVLLVLLLLMRTKAGRLFAGAIFVLHGLYVAHVLTISDPMVWLYMSDWGRGRLALSLFIDAGLLVYLLGAEASEALDLS